MADPLYEQLVHKITKDSAVTRSFSADALEALKELLLRVKLPTREEILSLLASEQGDED